MRKVAGWAMLLGICVTPIAAIFYIDGWLKGLFILAFAVVASLVLHILWAIAVSLIED